jgi:uncharacterized membrane protein
VRAALRDHTRAQRELQAKVIALAGELASGAVLVLAALTVLWAYETGILRLLLGWKIPFFFVVFLFILRAALVEFALLVVGKLTNTDIRRLRVLRLSKTVEP